MKNNTYHIHVGTKLKSNKYGKGVCVKVDETCKRFRYLFKFEDSTIIWLSHDDCEQMVMCY